MRWMFSICGRLNLLILSYSDEGLTSCLLGRWFKSSLFPCGFPFPRFRLNKALISYWRLIQRDTPSGIRIQDQRIKCHYIDGVMHRGLLETIACESEEAWEVVASLLGHHMHRTFAMTYSDPPTIEKKRLHFVGICGKAMGGIAAALATEGWRVTGSDEKCYQPMMGFLSSRGIRVSTPYSAGNVPTDADLVVVGKRVATENPELLHVVGHGPAYCSFPQFLHHQFLRHSRNAVVTGGVGKTTTTSMLAWILEDAGQRPDYLIGGLARNFPAPARFSGGRFAVLEGDEYASCFDDPRPKFLHYQPEVGVITNIVEDHPDIYRNLGEVCQAFSDFIALLPPHGALILADDDEAGVKLAQ